MTANIRVGIAPNRTPADIEAAFERIVDELTRRGFFGAAIGSATLLGLSACGSSDPHRGGSTAPAATRRVDSVHGSIAVPVEPKRIVTLDGFSMAALFDLGLEPVGVYSAGEQYVEPQFLSRWRGIAKISGGTVGGAVDVERVAALQPDLVLGIDAQKPPYEQLRTIAPTVILPFSASGSPWRDMTQDVAAAVGRTAALDDLQRRYRTRAEQIRTRYATALDRSRWDVLQGGFDQGQFWLYGPRSPIGAILADAGVRFATATAGVTNAQSQQSVSYEQIGRLTDADAIFYYTTNDDQPANLGRALFGEALWKGLPAARAGHLFGSVYFLPSGYSDALGALDSLETALKRLDGAA